MQENLNWIAAPTPGKNYRDPATGLFGNDLFLLELDREFLRSARSGDPFTVAFLQLDGAADDEEKLPVFGSLIEGNIRDVDLACRCSNDLFAVLLMKTSAEAATWPESAFAGRWIGASPARSPSP